MVDARRYIMADNKEAHNKKNIPLNVKMIKRFFPRRFIIAKLTKIPVFKQLIDKMLFEEDEILYIPKDNVITINKPIFQTESFVLPSQVLEHFVNQANHHVIMDFCICRESARCKDYPRNLGCLFLGETAQKINPALGRQVTKKEALDHLAECRQKGLVHLVGRNKLDSVWLKVKPGENLLTICNCCPCCCLWLILPHLTQKISKKIKRMPGVSISVNDSCIGCGSCVDICFVNAITICDDIARIDDSCRGCGRCIDKCPQNAIDILITDSKYIENAIDTISSKVKVS